mgnify:CR=1 FL=1
MNPFSTFAAFTAILASACARVVIHLLHMALEVFDAFESHFVLLVIAVKTLIAQSRVQVFWIYNLLTVLAIEARHDAIQVLFVNLAPLNRVYRG